MNLLTLVGAVLVLGVLGGCDNAGAARTHHDVVELAAHAKGEAHAIGTLATLGSFEWDAAPLKTHAAAGLLHIPQLLHDHKYTKAQAQAKLDQVDAAHDLIQEALAICKQNDHTGKCTGDAVRARTLLDRARDDLAVADQGMACAEQNAVGSAGLAACPL